MARERSLMARATDLLARREYSRAELWRKLAPHAESPAEVEEVLDRLAERGWQSDARFAGQLTASKGTRYGSRRLRHEMREKGVDGEHIDAALDGHDDLAVARDVWTRKFGTPPASREERARQIRFMAARGFPMGVIARVLRGAGDDDADGIED